ncbi:hypothetical protein OU994_06200 [Pseudoduganella sp. SL102]|uniref:hypothetical protein n=1 Tax=Pseudoduganella sp. SL102 TaxID=2995154 RepID=UPI00248CA6E0|nr:hypothetical protein [Pseudoduganella sp. SL102]WBS03877.1 hypothetical protein OU994_06200 [Pseudoduganella sp. SL102]
MWHAWLRYSPASLDAFCERHFGQRIPHVEAAGMAGGMALPMATSLVMARRLDGLDLAGPGVPRLFATDRMLRMPAGFGYEARGNWMLHSPLDRHGRPAGEGRVEPGTEPDFLLAAGLIAKGHHEWWRLQCRRRAERNGAGRAADEAANSAIELAANGSDSGGGGGCGSSCGGGCGGGGCGS